MKIFVEADNLTESEISIALSNLSTIKTNGFGRVLFTFIQGKISDVECTFKEKHETLKGMYQDVIDTTT